MNKDGKTNMTVRLPTEYYEHLKNLGFKLSAKENRRIGLSELVRRALDKEYPIPQKEAQG